ncbi:MAG: M13 family metallopeptidase [Xanthomonadaceae bacterium]|nr:M13 family metallopeptidase [Xanthomonadaceae bacterium]MDE1959119.1 M13 family metallopeptidase [Xanthomonadaceae bacterium]MDE2178917.1 M13 family metallopeptidase [Xanthomonadaceae bacterium]MDE2246867.1 M13 family metallopeptidase [Xanthomonadaceae bacterium]
MNKNLLKPLALAIGLTLSLGAVAATDSSVFNVKELDTKVSPCDNLNQFVNEKWIATHPIPADKTRWGAFDELAEKSLATQRAIIEAAAREAASVKPGTIRQQLGDFYLSGMNEAAIDKAGYTPLQPQLSAIAAIRSTPELVSYIDQSFAKGDGPLFAFGSGADFKNAKMQIGYAFQGGLGLPTRDYYFDAKYAKTRADYLAYVGKLLGMVGIPADQARTRAQWVMDLETRLAKASLAPVELRTPSNQYHFVSLAEADRLTPNFSWPKFFAAQGVNADQGFSLSQPAFFTAMGKALAEVPVSHWQAYLAFHAASSAAPYLSQPFQQARFDFYSKELGGQPQMEPRWKRVLRTVNGQMGMALGELYVAKAFPPEAKARALELVNNVHEALREHIENVPWMSPATKAKALAKWKTVLPKIGYPDKWRSWQGLHITPDSYYANVEAAMKFDHDYDLSKIGKPTDRYEWGMTPQTVNAYYNPTDNTINFPAAILQPPFFYAHGDDAINYGGIGAVIGHEMSHGYDDEGSQFDAYGNNVNWWTKADRAAFDARTAKLVRQFDGYSPLPGLHVNGKLTLGENIADLGGLNIAYTALQNVMKKDPALAKEKIDGYTEDQRYFMNWARVWRGSTRPAFQKLLLNVDPHSPQQFRANGAPSNMPAFWSAFQCKPGEPMVRSGARQVVIW